MPERGPATRSETPILLSAMPHDGNPGSFASLSNMLDATAIADLLKAVKVLTALPMGLPQLASSTARSQRRSSASSTASSSCRGAGRGKGPSS